MTIGPHVPHVIWCNDRCHLLPSLLKTCSPKIIRVIDLCTTLSTLVLCVSRESKSIRGLLLASSWRGISTSLASHSAGYWSPLQPSMALTLGVVTLWVRFISDAKLETWNQKWRDMSSMLTCLTISYSDDHDPCQLNRTFNLALVVQICKRWCYGPNGIRKIQ